MSPPRKLHLRCSLPAPEARPSTAARTIATTDLEALGTLFHAAYVGTVDYEGESVQEARAAVLATFQGEFGAYVPGASMLVEQAGVPIAATFITMWQGKPLLAFAVTCPQHKGRGHCQACTAASMAALASMGHDELHLFVTRTNTPALKAYARLGFVDAATDG